MFFYHLLPWSISFSHQSNQILLICIGWDILDDNFKSNCVDVWMSQFDTFIGCLIVGVYNLITCIILWLVFMVYKPHTRDNNFRKNSIFYPWFIFQTNLNQLIHFSNEVCIVFICVCSLIWIIFFEGSLFFDRKNYPYYFFQ